MQLAQYIHVIVLIAQWQIKIKHGKGIRNEKEGVVNGWSHEPTLERTLPAQ